MHPLPCYRITVLLVRALSDRALVLVQCPFAASTLSEPQPDFLVAPLGNYVKDHPSEAYLIVEVSQSSLAYDRSVKRDLYAESGVPEYWIVNLEEGTIETHAEPRDGTYTEARTYRRGQSVRLRAFPDVTIAVDDALPPAPP